jgi:trimeric autotransporter adhesin
VTFTKANQAALIISSANSDAYPWSITLTTTGGNGAGAVTYAVANGTATGCADPGGVLTATTSGTCTVTATKALDPDYNAISSTPAQTVTFTKFTPTVTITNTTNPTGVGTGTLVLTATVTGASGGTAPSGTLTWTVTGPTSGGCTTSTLTAGSGQSTATCTITSPAVGTYTAKATYAGDTNYATLTTPSTFGAYIGGTTSDVPTGPEYYTINGNTAGSGSSAADTINPSTVENLTSITMIFSGAANSSSAQTATVGGKLGGAAYSLTAMSCTVTAGSTESCASSGSVVIPTGSSINMATFGNGDHTYFWIVTYTTTP